MVGLQRDSYIKSNNDSLQPVASIVVSIRSIMGVTQPSWIWHNKEPLYSEHCPFKLCLSVRLLRTLPLFYEHFRRCSSYRLALTCRHELRPSTPTATQGWKEQDNKSKLPLNTVYLSLAEGTGKRRGFKPSIWSSLMCVDSSCTKGLKQSLAVMSGWIPFPKYPDICILVIVGKRKKTMVQSVFTVWAKAQCVKSMLTNAIVLLVKLT